MNATLIDYLRIFDVIPVGVWLSALVLLWLRHIDLKDKNRYLKEDVSQWRSMCMQYHQAVAQAVAQPKPREARATPVRSVTDTQVGQGEVRPQRRGDGQDLSRRSHPRLDESSRSTADHASVDLLAYDPQRGYDLSDVLSEFEQ